ncbi:MAG: TetR/AcrR family transcriptional regulator [Acidimicrobiales bacterium]
MRQESVVRERIVSVAIAMIESDGAERVRVADLARRAGVGIPTIYYHFESRAHLIAVAQVSRYEAMMAPLRELMDTIEAALAAGDEVEYWRSLRRYFQLVFEPAQIEGKYAVGRLFLGDDGGQSPARDAADYVARQFSRWVKTVTGAQDRGWVNPALDATTLTALFWSAVVGQAMAAPTAKAMDADALMDLFEALVRVRTG